MEKVGRNDANDDAVSLLCGNEAAPEQLTSDELLAIRRMIREFSVIRATCPMAARALSTRPLPSR